MKGNEDPQSPRDQQCECCGLWFSARGHHSHEANCQFRELDVRIQPLAGEEGDEGNGSPPDLDVGGTPKEPEEGIGPSPEPATPTVDDVEEAADAIADVDDAGATSTARTDGGPQATAPPTFDVDEVEDDQEASDDEPETLHCPNCESDTGARTEDLTPGKRYRCTDCGKKVRFDP